MSDLSYKQLREVDVTAFVEKKNGLSYLSWAWAVDALLLRDPGATWEFKTHNDLPFIPFPDGTAMVSCQLTAFGKTHPWIHLPVMDHRNKSITNPDSFAVNTAMQRCLAKAISASTGIGMFLYVGEDLPPADIKNEEDEKKKQARVQELAEKFKLAANLDELAALWVGLKAEEQAWMAPLKDARKATLINGQPSGSKPAKESSRPPRSAKPSDSSAAGSAPSAE